MKEQNFYIDFNELNNKSKKISMEDIFKLNDLFYSYEMKKIVDKLLNNKKSAYLINNFIIVFSVFLIFFKIIYGFEEITYLNIFIISTVLISFNIFLHDFFSSFLKEKIFWKIAECINKWLKFSNYSKYNFYKEKDILISKNFIKNFDIIFSNKNCLKLDIFENWKNISLIWSSLLTKSIDRDEKWNIIYETKKDLFYSKEDRRYRKIPKYILIEEFYLIKISFEEKINFDIPLNFLDKIKEKGYEILIIDKNIYLKRENFMNSFFKNHDKNIENYFSYLESKLFKKDYSIDELNWSYLEKNNENLENYLNFYLNIKEIDELLKEIINFSIKK